MKYSIVFSKKGGNTELLANTISNCLLKDDCSYYGLPDDKALDADIIYCGFWTDKGCCDETTKEFIKKIHNKKIFLFGSAGFGGSKEYFDTIINKTKEFINNDCVLINSFMCQGKMKNSVKERYLKIKKDNPNVQNIDLLISNFDKALSHPDKVDLENLKRSIKR